MRVERRDGVRCFWPAFLFALVGCVVSLWAGCKKKDEHDGEKSRGNKSSKKKVEKRRRPVPRCEADKDFLTKDEKKTLLVLARRAIEAAVKEPGELDPDALIKGLDLTKALRKPMGAFVTLHKRGRLRGCIGYLQPIAPLFKAVISNAVSAALRDHRFPQVKAQELEELDLEISVLSVPVDVAGYEDIIVGCHGIILEKNGRRATFLPHVAPEQGWSREQTLEHLSRKAGLSPGAWRTGTSYKVYTALVFSEKEMKEEAGAKGGSE